MLPYYNYSCVDHHKSKARVEIKNYIVQYQLRQKQLKNE